jgi:hypothetical protein
MIVWLLQVWMSIWSENRRMTKTPIRKYWSKLPLVIGVLASVAMHAMFLVPLLVISMTAKPAELRPRTGRFEPEHFETPPQEKKPMLGLDEADESPSTFTWIGYDEYQEHIAALAEVDQAAFTTNPTGDQAMPPNEAAPQVPPTEQADQTPPAEQQAQSDPPITEAQPTDVPASSAGPTDATTDAPAPTSPQLIPLQSLLSMPELALEMSQQEGPPTPTKGQDQKDPTGEDGTRAGKSLPTQENPAASPKKNDKGQPTKPNESKPAQQPSEAEAPTKPQQAGDPADQADMESDPTSVIDAPPENWKAGKPLAAHGLELKPRRPNFTTLQSLTTAPGNPLVEIRFGSDGKPKEARIVSSSGDRASDSSILSSLYRWRASGKRLKTLKGKETIDIRIRILLTRPRRR